MGEALICHDPIFSVLIGPFILPHTWALMTQAVNVLLEGTPAQLLAGAIGGILITAAVFTWAG